MRVRPLIDCIMSEIEPFLFSDLGVNINSINHYLSVLPVILLYQSPYVHYMFFYILRYRLFRVFSYKSFICLRLFVLNAYHSLFWVIHLCTYVSLAT